MGTLEAFVCLTPVWWLMPVIPMLGKAVAGESLDFEASLVYKVQDSQGYTKKPCLRRDEKNKVLDFLKLYVWGMGHVYMNAGAH